jgi:hypothetical protein
LALARGFTPALWCSGQVPRWLAAHGVELPLAAWDCGLVYFTRH